MSHLPVDDVEESDIVVSGWGDDEGDLRDDLLQRWSERLERWDGRDKWEPGGEKLRSKQLCKLVRCVRAHNNYCVLTDFYCMVNC